MTEDEASVSVGSMICVERSGREEGGMRRRAHTVPPYKHHANLVTGGVNWIEQAEEGSWPRVAAHSDTQTQANTLHTGRWENITISRK